MPIARCPAGTEYGRLIVPTQLDGVYKNITFLVCNPNTSSDNSLALGLGFGLGIPGLIVMLYLFIRFYNKKIKDNIQADVQQNIRRINGTTYEAPELIDPIV